MTRTKKTVIIKKPFGKRTAKTQVSPSGMAAASQAVPGEFDSRHLLQVSIIRTICLSQANGSDYLFIFENRIFLLFFCSIKYLFWDKMEKYIF